MLLQLPWSVFNWPIAMFAEPTPLLEYFMASVCLRVCGEASVTENSDILCAGILTEWVLASSHREHTVCQCVVCVLKLGSPLFVCPSVTILLLQTVTMRLLPLTWPVAPSFFIWFHSSVIASTVDLFADCRLTHPSNVQVCNLVSGVLRQLLVLAMVERLQSECKGARQVSLIRSEDREHWSR